MKHLNLTNLLPLWKGDPDPDLSRSALKQLLRHQHVRKVTDGGYQLTAKAVRWILSRHKDDLDPPLGEEAQLEWLRHYVPRLGHKHAAQKLGVSKQHVKQLCEQGGLFGLGEEAFTLEEAADALGCTVHSVQGRMHTLGLVGDRIPAVLLDCWASQRELAGEMDTSLKSLQFDLDVPYTTLYYRLAEHTYSRLPHLGAHPALYVSSVLAQKLRESKRKEDQVKARIRTLLEHTPGGLTLAQLSRHLGVEGGDLKPLLQPLLQTTEVVEVKSGLYQHRGHHLASLLFVEAALTGKKKGKRESSPPRGSTSNTSRDEAQTSWNRLRAGHLAGAPRNHDRIPLF